MSLQLIAAVMRGRAPSLLELPDRPAAYEDVGRLCRWDDLFPITLLPRSRFERVLSHAIAGRRVRMDGCWHRPVGVRGWTHVVFRRERDGVRRVMSLDEMLAHLDAWDRTADRRISRRGGSRAPWSGAPRERAARARRPARACSRSERRSSTAPRSRIDGEDRRCLETPPTRKRRSEPLRQAAGSPPNRARAPSATTRWPRGDASAARDAIRGMHIELLASGSARIGASSPVREDMLGLRHASRRERRHSEVRRA